MKKLFIAVIFSFVVFMSCDDAAETAEPVVYIGGFFEDNGLKKACYWVNGERHKLDGVSVETITAVKGKVYAAGFYNEGDELKACYWADGLRNDVPWLIYRDGFSHGFGRITVDNGNVYINGNVDNSIYYWVNGVMQNPPTDGVISNVYAANGKVYISGYYKEGSVVKACYWVNGVRQELPGSDGFYAVGIVEENNKNFVAGYPSWVLKYPYPDPAPDFISCYWADNNQYFFQDMIIGYAVSEGDIYMTNFKCYKNGIYHSEDMANFYTMFAVSRGKVYTAKIRWDDDSSGYTEDGVYFPLDGTAYCIYAE
jgi:hypothetical protein